VVTASGNSQAGAIGLGPAHTHIPAEAFARSAVGNAAVSNAAVGNSVAGSFEAGSFEAGSFEAGSFEAGSSEEGNSEERDSRVVAEVAMKVLADILGYLAYYWVRFDSLPGTLEDSG